MDPRNLDRFFSPETTVQDPPRNPNHPYQVVIPIQSEGSCVARCVFCNYGRQDPKPYISPEDAIDLLSTGVDISISSGLVGHPEQLKLSLLKGGDISFYREFKSLLYAIAESYPRNLLKISTIASSKFDFFDHLSEMARRLREENEGYRLSLQISANSTDESQRTRIVNGGQLGPIRLYNMGEINEFSGRWVGITGRLPTITFTLFKDTIFDPYTIESVLDPNSVVLKMRRMHPETGMGLETISLERYSEAYHELTERGFKVIIGNPSSSELNHRLTTRRNFN